MIHSHTPKAQCSCFLDPRGFVFYSAVAGVGVMDGDILQNVVRLGICAFWDGANISQALSMHRTTENAIIIFVFVGEH